MKAVMISIHPKWCELIERGKKTVEVRKTRPKLETPFKVYIYETLGEKIKLSNVCKGTINRGCGKVIGEFVCNGITSLKAAGEVQALWNELQNTCISHDEIIKYANGKRLYYWNISDLVIYDKPKEIGEFKRFCDGVGGKIGCKGCKYYYTESNESIGFYEECGCDNLRPMKIPPQSWCYVEEVEQ